MTKLEKLYDEGCFCEINAIDELITHIGYGEICGCKVYSFELSQAVDTSSVNKIKKAYELSEKTGCPIIGVYNSDGVALSEGFEALYAYGELVKLSSRLSGVVPQISIVDGNCLGVTAAMAYGADVVIAVKGSDFYISPPSEATASDGYENGAVDCLADSFEEACDMAQSFISLLPANNLSAPPVFELDEAESDVYGDVISVASDNIITAELKGGYANGVRTLITTVNGIVAGFVCFENVELTPSRAYKAEALIKLCDAYNLPVITIADSKGISRENDASTLIACEKLLSAYASATCPKISLVTDYSAAGAYVILAGKGANADITLAWEGAKASPMNTQSAVAFLWNDRLANGESREALEREYEETLANINTAAESGAVDEVFPRELTKERLSFYLDMLSSKRETTIPRKHSVK